MERLKISEDKRYFVTPDGKPFSWLADTVWTMPQRLRWDEAEHLMQRRKAQGFTVLQICALDPERDVEMRSPAGDPALVDGDLTKPNEHYFRYLDRVLDKAEEHGFYVLLLPVWGQLVVGDDWAGGVYEKTVTEANAYDYACWIGNRYKDRSNILWCLGGDRMPIHRGVDYKNVWRRMAEGLAKGLTGEDLRHNEPSPVWESLLITYHACHEAETGLCSSFSYWDDSEQWIRFIMLQSGHGLQPKNYELVRNEYERENVMPVWDGEPAYELMPTSWPLTPETPRQDAWMVRRRAYWSLLAGAFGFTYGHACVWCSVAEQEKNFISPVTWCEALGSVGSEQMCHVRAFMESLQSMTAKPCQQIFVEESRREGTLETHGQAACTEDYICLYLPSGGDAALNIGDLWNKNEVGVWYWNPSTAALSEKTVVTLENGLLRVTAPSAGKENDWIVVLTEANADKPIRSESYGAEKVTKEEKKVFAW